MIYAQRSSSDHPTNHDDKGWLHPGEYGRVAAWLKRSKRDLKMCRKIGDNKPSAVFETRAEMYITVPAIPTPPGMTAPDAAVGEAYICRTDGTPKLKKSINFTSPSLGDGTATAPAVTQVIIANPKYITLTTIGQNFERGFTLGSRSASPTCINIWWRTLRKAILKTCSL
jgi:hypothetical protein